MIAVVWFGEEELRSGKLMQSADKVEATILLLWDIGRLINYLSDN